ncbi:hypothetical protein [Mobilicoccus caccae]|uniref:hypothetical protein n=1 Tax=Mobilicoccus caccae TaxID=1859295 RepID=UPI0024E0F041|nr:hypothetical protein [Mobilicoccus caccae]
MALPVVAGALERSLQLAASMESRGYGRAGRGGVRRQRRATWCSVAGIVGVCVGVFGLLDARTPVAVAAPLVGAGLVLAVGALALGGASDRRTPTDPIRGRRPRPSSSRSGCSPRWPSVSRPARRSRPEAPSTCSSSARPCSRASPES